MPCRKMRGNQQDIYDNGKAVNHHILVSLAYDNKTIITYKQSIVNTYYKLKGAETMQENDIQLTANEIQEIDSGNIRGRCGMRGSNCWQIRHMRCGLFKREVIRLLDKVFATDADVTALTAQITALEARVAALEASGGAVLPNVAANATTLTPGSPATATVVVS